LQDFSNILNLISALKAKDEKAFAYLYDNYSASMYGIIGKIITNEDDANDVMQDVFINIWKNIDTYNIDKGGSLFTWMLNIARNKAIDKYRQQHRIVENQKEMYDVSMSNVGILTNSIKVDTIGVSNLVDNMKPELKQLIDLHYYKGFTHQEITVITNMPLGTVKTKIRTAMSELKIVFGIK
jgi:RNA polymerase sigma-70 factor, ECF subfamily